MIRLALPVFLLSGVSWPLPTFPTFPTSTRPKQRGLPEWRSTAVFRLRNDRVQNGQFVSAVFAVFVLRRGLECRLLKTPLKHRDSRKQFLTACECSQARRVFVDLSLNCREAVLRFR